MVGSWIMLQLHFMSLIERSREVPLANEEILDSQFDTLETVKEPTVGQSAGNDCILLLALKPGRCPAQEWQRGLVVSYWPAQSRQGIHRVVVKKGY
jgi:hypothetical protein